MTLDTHQPHDAVQITNRGGLFDGLVGTVESRYDLQYMVRLFPGSTGVMRFNANELKPAPDSIYKG